VEPTRVDDPERSRAYHRWQFRLSALGFAVTVAYLVAWLASGGNIALRDALVAYTPHWWLQVPLALLVLGIGHRLVTLPLSWVSGFLLPRRFVLLHQPFRLWLADVAKAGAIATLLGIVATLVVYGLLRATAWWWLWGALLFLLGYALLALAAPTLLIPLFYRLSPLQDGDLRARVLRVAARAEVPVLGVWVADQSRKSRTANAAVVGLGRTRRILLFDTLLSELAADEIETVLAHELGHQVHGDIGRGLLVQAALTLGTFWIADHALRSGTRALGLEGLADPAGLPLFGLVLMAVGLFALPIANGWSRHVERQADDFALRLTGNAPAFIAAMERLAVLNLAEAEPHPIKELLFYSHPSIRRRVRSASAFLHQST
jgi:STE24 endopeptidase